MIEPSCSRFRSVWTVVVLLLMIHAGLLAWSATKHSPTMNEPGHLVAGLSYWKFGRFELYRVNPPLVKLIAALPVMAAGYEEDWSGFHEEPGARPVFHIGSNFIAANGERSIWLFTIARWACIPISLIGGLFCFLWSRELWGNNLAGLISLTLWCFEPNILAHGELVTPDCAATSFGLGATYYFWRWLRQPTWGRAGVAGILFGLAQLSKMTWVILFGLWPLLWMYWWISQKQQTSKQKSTPSLFPSGRKGGGRTDQKACDSIALTTQSEQRHTAPRRIISQAAQLVTILLLGLYVLNLCYGFSGSFTRLKDFTFVSSALTGLEHSGTPGNLFDGNILGEIPIPVPKQYLLGMDVQKHDFEDYGQMSYLRGEWKDGGWWYYYIYGLAVKTPHGTQFMLLIAITTLIYRKATRHRLFVASPSGGITPNSLKEHDRATGQPPTERPVDGVRLKDLVVVMTPALVVLVLVSSQLEFNHHVRYVLPVLGFTFVMIGVTADWFATDTPIEDRE